MQTDSKIGPVGQRLAENVAALRGRIPLRELSARLEKFGRKVLPSGIMNVERSARRIDVDDLMALAAAFEVSPNRLLLPANADLEEVTLTPNLRVEAASAWRWATGDEPLGLEPWSENPSEETEEERWERARQFRRRNRPHDVPPRPMSEILAHEDVLRPIWKAVQVACEHEGVDLELVKAYLRLREEGEALQARRRAAEG
jgi:transcriptional regulator with XRE-family HTH domain